MYVIRIISGGGRGGHYLYHLYYYLYCETEFQAMVKIVVQTRCITAAVRRAAQSQRVKQQPWQQLQGLRLA